MVENGNNPSRRSEQLDRIVAEFLEAARAGEAPDRRELLDRHPELADGIKSFFADHDRLERPEHDGATGPLHPSQVYCGEMIGPYKLLQQIGDGGMGSVWMADQLQPIKRRVALKLIKPGHNSKEVIARFEAERRALAMMDHQNIAKVLDAGVSDDGRPYFVMELVQGVRFTKYCDKNRLALRERLELFIPVCQAVQHAHQKGIIHRDIKPSNVLVTLYDGKPMPKVIDFGLAKALQHQTQLTDKTLFTQFGQVVGTLQYMSPEQAELNALDIDTRTDIYSLGVMLYELLTGSTPIDKKTLEEEAVLKVLASIRENDPPCPSTRLSSASNETMSGISEQRRIEPNRLKKLLRGELDWIVMKALEKDRTRRYETASGLAEEIRRHLAGDPVQARPQSTGYRLRKYVQKNKGLVTSLISIATLLILGIVGTSWFGIQANNARRDAFVQKKRVEANLDRAQRAERDLRQAVQVAEDNTQLATQRAYESLRAQARAARWSRRAGKRFDSLDAVRSAAELLPALELSPTELDQRRLDLRNEAIACMALADLRLVTKWESKLPSSQRTDITYERNFERYIEADREGNITVRSMEDNRELFQLPGFGLAPWTRELSPDGRFLAVRYDKDGHGPAQVYVWDLSRREPILRIPNASTKGVLDFSPDSQLVAVGRNDHSIHLFDITTGDELEEIPAGPTPYDVRFHPTGKKLAVANVDGVRIHNLESREVVVIAHSAKVSDLAWHPNGDLLATGCTDGRAYVCDVRTKRQLEVLEGHTANVTDVAFNPTGGLLATAGWDNTTRLWDPMTGRELLSAAGVCTIFSLDGRLSFQGAGRVGYWIVADGRECRTLPRSQAWGIDFSPNGRLLAVANNQGVELWDSVAGKRIAFLNVRKTMSAVFHPNGKELITSGNVGVWRWRIERTSDEQGSLIRLGPPQEVLAGKMGRIALTADGQTMVVDTGISKAMVVNLADPERRTVLEPHSKVDKVTISPDGRWVATCTWQGSSIKVWDAETGKFVRELAPDWTSATVAYSPDGKWLVGSDGQEYRFWEVDSWRLSHRVKRDHSGGTPGSLAFTHRGNMMTINYSNRVVQLIDPHTGRHLATLEAPDTHRIGWLCFAPQGNYVAAIKNGGIQLWDLRRIRKQLDDMGLDWDLPSHQPAAAFDTTEPLRVEVDLGELS